MSLDTTERDFYLSHLTGQDISPSTTLDTLRRMYFTRNASNKRCLKVDYTTQRDRMGGETIIAHTTNGRVGIYADMSAMASGAGHECHSTVNGWRALSCGPDYGGGGFLPTAGWGGRGTLMWHLPTAAWWEDDKGSLDYPGMMTPDTEWVKFCRTVAIGYTIGGVGKPFDHVGDAPLAVKTAWGLDGAGNDNIIDDPTEGYTFSASDAYVTFRTAGGKPKAYFINVYIDRGFSDGQENNATCKLLFYVPNAPAGNVQIGAVCYPMQMSTKGTGFEIPGSGLAYVETIRNRDGNGDLVNVHQGWNEVPVTYGRLRQGMNVVKLTATGDFQLATKPSVEGYSTWRNHSGYHYTALGYDKFIHTRGEWTIYRDHDYIDVQLMTPPESLWETDGGSSPGSLGINFSTDGEMEYRRIRGEDKNKVGRKAVFAWNRIGLPDGTTLVNPDDTEISGNPLAEVGDKMSFWHDNGSVERWRWSLEKIEDGDKNYPSLVFDNMGATPYYNPDGYLKNYSFELWDEGVLRNWTKTGTGACAIDETNLRGAGSHKSLNLSLEEAGTVGISQVVAPTWTTIKADTDYQMQFYHMDADNQIKLQIKSVQGGATCYYDGAQWVEADTWITYAVSAYPAWQREQFVFTTLSGADPTLTIAFTLKETAEATGVNLDHVMLTHNVVPNSLGDRNDLMWNAVTVPVGERTAKYRLDLSTLAVEL